METSALTEVKKHLRPGRVYRREDFTPWSASVDRRLKALVDAGDLKKLRYGLYYCPKRLSFGEVPADEHELLQAFLKTDRFVVTSPNLYNLLGLGTTQLYDKRVVYNQKRHGTFDLGGQVFQFERRMNVPRKLTREFLLVDLVNELDQLAEDRQAVSARVADSAKRMDSRKLSRAVKLYSKHSRLRSWKALGYA
jgi:hypothetical protein